MVESVFIDKTLIFKSLCEQVMDGPNHNIWLTLNVCYGCQGSFGF